MSFAQIIVIVSILSLGIGAFLISFLQFKEKGYLFNNAYLWASQAERKQMEENETVKRLYHRQSGFVFLFIGCIFMTNAARIATAWTWMSVAVWALIGTTVVYIIVSSVQIERYK